ncbi:hypothetical protein EVAR_80249_1 [Eumeta japonica]|uniref:Uncharacterized protein n=1 Tax=Eumeta variegata TaxID=151549 RepID=A0A4C1UCF0_EUMVA|nr:hypothetical protein EVAR_80249_1 [Eumeta japonica]
MKFSNGRDSPFKSVTRFHTLAYNFFLLVWCSSLRISSRYSSVEKAPVLVGKPLRWQHWFEHAPSPRTSPPRAPPSRASPTHAPPLGAATCGSNTLTLSVLFPRCYLTEMPNR